MNELEEYISHGSRKMSGRDLEGFREHLPALQLKLIEIHAPKQPHLIKQVELLIRFVEDVADGVWKSAPYVTLAEALFALDYLLKGVDIIPDSIPGIGYSDDSGIVRSILARSEAHFEEYCAANNLHWERITTKA